MDHIEVVGAREHNLKNLRLQIPKGKLVAFTGVSGSGKSSLIFNTIYAESFRRFSDASQVPVYLMGRSSMAQNRRAKFSALRGLPAALGLSQRQGVAGRLSTVGTISGLADLLRVYYAAFGARFCRSCDVPLLAMSFDEVMSSLQDRFMNRRVFFFAPIAEKRKGAFADELEKFRKYGFTKVRLNGKLVRLDGDSADLKLDARKLNTVELVIDAFELREERMARAERAVSQAIDAAKLVRVETSEGDQAEIYNMSSACPSCGESAPDLDPRHFSHSSLGKCVACDGSGEEEEGVDADINPCVQCGGSRLRQDLPIVRVQKETFHGLSMKSLEGVREFVRQERESREPEKAREKVLGEMERLLQVQCDLGLGHLVLNRAGNSLSPGDLQRLRLSSLLSNKLRGAMYVLDEPCQGLTETETKNLLKYLKEFSREGSSVIVVEHHPDFLRGADQIFVMGPGAGEKGGELVQQISGSEYDPQLEMKEYEENVKSEHLSLIADPLRQPRSQLAKGVATLSLKPLRGLSHSKVKIHSHAINLLRGPSGSGKSTFVNLGLIPLIESIENVTARKRSVQTDFFEASLDKSFVSRGLNVVKPGSLVRSSRRTVASALDVLVPLRSRFEVLSSSQLLGLTAADFSWNSAKGQCPECKGKGYVEFEQKYAPPLRVECTACGGHKLKSQSLLPRLRGKNFAEVLDMSVEAAASFFANDRQIRTRLEAALEFGLGYVRLNQSMETLSGGEIQRLILTLDLKRVKVDGYWYVLTHPGTGLHLPDIQVLGRLLKRLIDRGASFVLVENREEFAEFADHVIEF